MTPTNHTIHTMHPSTFQFAAGDEVFIVGHPQFTAKITNAQRLGDYRWPHYTLVDRTGTEWTVPQIHLSRSPILP
jgi:hypothetical protein